MDSQGEPAVPATMSGDGGSVVGEDEDEAATDDRPENRGEHTQIASKNRTRSTGGSGRGRSDSPHARTAGRTDPSRARQTHAQTTHQQVREPQGVLLRRGFPRREIGQSRRGEGPRWRLRRVRSAHLVPDDRAPPPGDAGIPGTERGEGQIARAAAAGSAMPDVMEACLVRPMSDGWPDAWNPVALLRLFPSSADPDAGTAFDKLSEVLTPREDDEGGLPEEGDEAETGRQGGGGGGGGFGGEKIGGFGPAGCGDAAGGGDDSTRAQLARRSESKSPRLKSPEASADGGGVVGTDRSIGPTGMDVDDTGSVHSGGSMAGNTGGPVSETGPAMRLAAARVELEGGYVAFVVSDELLPADVRRSVAAAVGGAPSSGHGCGVRLAAGGRRRRGRVGGVRRRIREILRHRGGARRRGEERRRLRIHRRRGEDKRAQREATSATRTARTLKDLLGDAAARSNSEATPRQAGHRRGASRAVGEPSKAPAVGHRAERRAARAARGVADPGARARRPPHSGHPAAQALEAPPVRTPVLQAHARAPDPAAVRQVLVRYHRRSRRRRRPGSEGTAQLARRRRHRGSVLPRSQDGRRV